MITPYSDKYNLTAQVSDSEFRLSDNSDISDEDTTNVVNENYDISDTYVTDTPDAVPLDLPEPDNVVNNSERAPASLSKHRNTVWSNFWLNLGAGVNSNINSQTLDNQLNFDYNSIVIPSYSAVSYTHLTLPTTPYV